MKNKTKIRAYIYPLTSRLKTGVYNPYLDNFIKANQSHIGFENRNSPSGTGIFDILKYIHKVDFVFLNWVENLPDKKGGLVQYFFFLVFLKFKKILRIKIIWTLHNKISHTSDNYSKKKRIFLSLLKSSDIIITHSREGIPFAESHYKNSSSKIFYFPHPLDFNESVLNEQKLYDILIWGTIASYKGIDKFLEFFTDAGLDEKYKMLIAGKIIDKGYAENIRKFESKNISINDQFIGKEELGELIRLSRIVLFTYSGESVLSSGALMDSVSHKACVVGPDSGAFSDLGEMGLIKTYNSFTELPGIINEIVKGGYTPQYDNLESFIKSHTWEEFGNSLKVEIDTLTKSR